MKEKDLKAGFLLNFYGELLTEKQRDAIEMYYDEDMSLAEIAEHTGITRQGVRDCIKRGEALLFEMEDKLKLAERFEEVKGKVAEILTLAVDIREKNIKYAMSSGIDVDIDKIIKLSKEISE